MQQFSPSSSVGENELVLSKVVVHTESVIGARIFRRQYISTTRELIKTSAEGKSPGSTSTAPPPPPNYVQVGVRPQHIL